ncbi:MAG: cytochrome c oxidase assembly protein subunit 15 [Candidatus Azotimanducaceae bacterium]|jgi:cytochrome c oxidase assembly protein subunit 15
MPQNNRAIIYWLIIVSFTIFCMIVVGGVTRLTESGLSMVEWRPLLGIIPPISEADWQAVFTAYQNFPQYQTVNHQMDLEEFKFIFYWEYGHRVLGRFIGIIFFVPFILFLVLKKVPKNMVLKLWIGLFLGGLQGLMGWYMVKSGLVDIPRVSHYRLAAHLILALVILCYLTWLILDLLEQKRFDPLPLWFRRLASLTFVLISFQILYGAFVAGSRAGYGYNTFPLMNGEFMPEAMWQLTPIWLNWLENNASLQFVHRWLGAVVLLVSVIIGAYAFRSEDRRFRACGLTLLFVVLAQFIIGVLTLVKVVPVGLGSIHQAGACIVLVSILCLVYFSRPMSAK